MTIRYSLRFAMLLLLLHMTAAAIVYMTDMPLLARIPVSLLILASLAYFLLRDIYFLLPHSWQEISLEDDGITVITRDGSRLFGRVSNESFVSSYFILLRVRLEETRLPASRAIFPDSLEAGAFRDISVRLRYSWII